MDIINLIIIFAININYLLFIHIQYLHKHLRMEIFDNFKEFNRIKKKVLKLTGHNFECPIFEKNENYSGCSGSLYDLNTADYFLYIYFDFGWQFLRERAEEENNENYKRQLLSLIDYCVYRENEIKEDFLDFLSEFDLDQYYNNLCKYIPIRTI